MLERIEAVDEEPDDGLRRELIGRDRISEIRLKRGKLGGTAVLNEFVSVDARQKVRELLDQITLHSSIVVTSLVAREANESKLKRYDQEILRISRMLAQITRKMSCEQMVEVRVAALNAIRDLQTDPHLPKVYLGSVNALDEDWQEICAPQIKTVEKNI